MTRELGVDAPGATVRFGEGESLEVAVAPTTDSPRVTSTSTSRSPSTRWPPWSPTSASPWAEGAGRECGGRLSALTRMIDTQLKRG
jgi:hypothetical protein